MVGEPLSDQPAGKVKHLYDCIGAIAIMAIPHPLLLYMRLESVVERLSVLGITLNFFRGAVLIFELWGVLNAP